jgi:hypothetical protein
LGWEHLLLVELVRDASDSVESGVMRDIRLGNSRQRPIIRPAGNVSSGSDHRSTETAAQRTPLNIFLNMKDIVFLLALVAGTWALKYQAPPDNVRGRTFSLQAANVPENAKIQPRSDLGIRDLANSLELWDYWDQSIPLG